MSLDIGYLERPGNQRLCADQLPLFSNYSLTGQTMSNQPLTEYILSLAILKIPKCTNWMKGWLTHGQFTG